MGVVRGDKEIKLIGAHHCKVKLKRNLKTYTSGKHFLVGKRLLFKKRPMYNNGLLKTVDEDDKIDPYLH